MTAIFAWLARVLGIGGMAFLALYIYDWGIPGASRIPYLSSIPIIGDLTTGRAHTYAADQVKLATANMVTTFERNALKAQLDRERQSRRIAEAAAARAQERADATELARQKAEARLADLTAEAKKDGLGGWSEQEMKWLDNH